MSLGEQPKESRWWCCEVLNYDINHMTVVSTFFNHCGKRLMIQMKSAAYLLSLQERLFEYANATRLPNTLL